MYMCSRNHTIEIPNREWSTKYNTINTTRPDKYSLPWVGFNPMNKVADLQNELPVQGSSAAWDDSLIQVQSVNSKSICISMLTLVSCLCSGHDRQDSSLVPQPNQSLTPIHMYVHLYTYVKINIHVYTHTHTKT